MQKLTTVILLCVIVIACDEMQIVDMVSDLSGAPDGMVLIPAGEATLGCPSGYGHPRTFERGILERQKTVYVDAFYMDTHEVTSGEFRKFLDATGWEGSTVRLSKNENYPIFANFHEAKAYAEWVGKRLPTNDEWEKAARGGLEGKHYPWGNEDPTEEHARVRFDNIQPESAVEVGSYTPNGYGLYDMSGNAAEWTTHVWREGWGATRGGGWWLLGRIYARVYERDMQPHRSHHSNIGFRCAVDVP